jgi:polygalacturonase
VKVSRRDFLGSVAAGVIEAGASVGWAHRSVADDVGNRPVFNVKSFGAAADGSTLDTSAVNLAIAAAAAAGGGTVRFPPGTYLCHSLRLKNFVALQLEPGAIIQAAPAGGYDTAELNEPFERYQDFGHNHWHNSLIWGEGLRDVAIVGSGLICGRGLSRGVAPEPGLPPADTPGAADKAIAFKSCRNVAVRGIAILAAGHFGILATGVDNLTLENLTIDTNRDGINVDCCRNVRVSSCRVNSPWDDGICLKSSFALGEARATENVSIKNCYVTGAFALGTMLDGTRKRIEANGGLPTGRIKCGTESNGGFKNITISNCFFESCRGFALESVDGGPIEDVTFSGITMRDIRNAPFFLRLGARLRAPAGTAPGTLKRVVISDVTCNAPANDMPAIIAGIPGHPIEDVTVRDVSIVQKGGGTAATATIVPPEQERDYPEPSFLGPLPAQGLLVRHARNVTFHRVEIASTRADERPFIWLGDVEGADFSGLTLSPRRGVPALHLRRTGKLRISASAGLPDTSLDQVNEGQFP